MTTSKKQSKAAGKLGTGCLILFALPFAGFGAFMAGMVAWDFWTWSAVQSWVPTPARLLKAEARENNDGDGGTTHRAVAEYRYEFAGKTYENDRVAIHAGSDNIGTYQRDRGRELVRLKKGGKPITCYVNPDNPAEAILFRDLRPGYVAFKGLFALVFSGVGFGLLAGSVWAHRDAKREAVRRQAYPNEPWKWKEDWRAGVIHSSTGKAAIGVGIFAALWNAISWPAFTMMFAEGGQPVWAKLLVTLFPLIGTALAAYAVLLALRRLKWGVSEFQMAAVPGVLGGPLAGVISTPAPIRAEHGYTVRLACTRQESDGDSTKEVTQWEHEETIMRNLSARMGRTLIPVQFIIPYELPPSGGDIKWKLTAKAATSGVDYHAEFEVPVFQTDASSPTPPTQAEVEIATASPPIELAALVKQMGAVLEEDFPDRKTLYFPMARNRWISAFLVVFTAVWLGACVGLFYSDAPWYFPLAFCLIGVFIVAITVTTVFERTRLEFGPQGVAYHRRVLGPGRRREFAAGEIKEILVEKSGTTAGNTAYWKLTLRTKDGSDHKLATEIASRTIADRLATEISRAIGLSKKRTSDGSSRIFLDAELPAELRAE